MIECDELTVIPNIKDPSKLTIHYKTSIEMARNNFCDTMMEYLSDVNFINHPTFEQRENVLRKELYALQNVVMQRFMEIYRE